MNEEEKRAIEWLKNANFFSARIYAPVLLSLIEKQDKEIERQKDLYEKLLNGYNERVKEIEELEKPKYLYNAITGEITRIENEKGIDKNKIKEKIKEIKIILDELLEE